MTDKLLTSFRIHCDAAGSAGLDVGADQASIILGQKVQRNGTQELWDFVLILAKKGDNGQLETRIVLCHPDWDDPIELASIESSRGALKVELARDEPRPP